VKIKEKNAALLGYGVCLVRNEETSHVMAHSQKNTCATETSIFASVSNTFLNRYEVVRTREGKIDTPRTYGDRHWAKAAKCYAYTCECSLQVTTISILILPVVYFGCHRDCVWRSRARYQRGDIKVAEENLRYSNTISKHWKLQRYHASRVATSQRPGQYGPWNTYRHTESPFDRNGKSPLISFKRI
jgi:hypothetical protein